MTPLLFRGLSFAPCLGQVAVGINLRRLWIAGCELINITEENLQPSNSGSEEDDPEAITIAE